MSNEAFPREYSSQKITGHEGSYTEHYKAQKGMTYRQWLAGLAMQAFISSGLNTGAWDDYMDLAKSSINAADALIAQEAKGDA